MENIKYQIKVLNFLVNGLAIVSMTLAASSLILLCCYIWQDLDYDLGKMLVIGLILTFSITYVFKKVNELLENKQQGLELHKEPLSLAFLIQLEKAIPYSLENHNLLKKIKEYKSSLINSLSNYPVNNN